MISDDCQNVVRQSKRIYEQRLQDQLESTDSGRYVAIEPESGEHFLGDSLDIAVLSALQKYPQRLTHCIRIGHQAALHLGVLVR